MYAPPELSYARTVCRYESTTIARRTEIAIEIGRTRCSAAIPAPRRTTIAASVAYATDESGSDAKIGSAISFRSSVSSSSSDASERDENRVLVGCEAAGEVDRQLAPGPLGDGDERPPVSRARGRVCTHGRAELQAHHASRLGRGAYTATERSGRPP